jgi:hypothetical protein
MTIRAGKEKGRKVGKKGKEREKEEGGRSL